METTLDIKSIQCMNLLSFMTGVKAMDCFEYNSSIIFVIQEQFVKNALMNNGEKIRNLSSKIRKNVKIVAMPKDNSIHNIEKFILSITYPVKFKNIVINNNEMTIYATPQTKALLIGRNSARLIELSSIAKKYFEVKKVMIR